MKIAIVSDFPLDVPYGGLQTHVYHLTHHLSLIKDLEVHVIALADKNEEIKKNGITIHMVKRPLNIPLVFTIPFDAREVKKKILEIDPDIVHVHGTHYPYNLISGIISKVYPTIVTVHGIMAIEYKFNRGLNFLGGIPSYFLEKYAFSKIKHIIVCSPIIEELIANMSKAKIYIIPNGINYEEIRKVEALKPVKHPSILFVGLLEKIKGVDLLINSIPIIKKQILDVHVYIAGSGSQEAALKELTKELKIEDNVDFLGYIKGDEKYSYFKSTDICVVPSRYESFGIIILEAMASGCPIVASNVGNIPLLLNDEEVGLKFNPDDVDDLADKIKMILMDKKLQEKMGKNSLKMAEDFEWDKIAAKTVGIYEILKKDNNSF